MACAIHYATEYLVLRGIGWRFKTVRHVRELLKGSTEHLILSLIGQERMYGYKLIKEMNRRSHGYFQFREGTLYPALHRLENEGLIEGKWERLSTGQERRYYYLTGRGRRALSEKRDQWRNFAAAVNLIVEQGNLAEVEI